jgi:predicted nucleic acid-binding protein
VTADWLLDSSAALALVALDHAHHDRLRRWAAGRGPLALCPIAEGFLVRATVRLGSPAELARQALAAMYASGLYEFWPDDASYAQADLSHVRGHRQVTDAYLVALARSHGARLVTLDQALAAQFPDTAVLPD